MTATNVIFYNLVEIYGQLWQLWATNKFMKDSPPFFEGFEC